MFPFLFANSILYRAPRTIRFGCNRAILLMRHHSAAPTNLTYTTIRFQTDCVAAQGLPCRAPSGAFGDCISIVLGAPKDFASRKPIHLAKVERVVLNALLRSNPRKLSGPNFRCRVMLCEYHLCAPLRRGDWFSIVLRRSRSTFHAAMKGASRIVPSPIARQSERLAARLPASVFL